MNIIHICSIRIKKGGLFDGVIFTLLNVSGETNNKAAKYTKQKLSELKGEINQTIMMVGVFNAPPSVLELIDRKISKDLKKLYNKLNQ